MGCVDTKRYLTLTQAFSWKKKKPAVRELLTAGMAGMAGIEPARAESKSAVLPLDYTPTYIPPSGGAQCKIPPS